MAQITKTADICRYVSKLYDEKKREIGSNAAITYINGTLHKLPKRIARDLESMLNKSAKKSKIALYRTIAKSYIKLLKDEREDLKYEIKMEYEEDLREYKEEQEKKYSSVIKQNKRYKKRLKCSENFIGMCIIDPLMKRIEPLMKVMIKETIKELNH